MDLARRQFVKALLGGVVLSNAAGCAQFLSSPRSDAFSDALLIGCTKDTDGHYAITAVNGLGDEVYHFPLAQRGHGFAHHPSHNHLAAFSRRPGDCIEVIDAHSGAHHSRINAEPERFFYGHGVYSENGQRLFTSEGITETCEGVIGVYDVQQNYKRVDEFVVDGIGPHQIARLSDDRLVIAVGGIQTDGRAKTNIETMSPSLVYYYSDGTLIEKRALDERLLSVRHLDVGEDDTVYFALQYQDSDPITEPLIWSHRLGATPQPMLASQAQWLGCKGYIGSIMVNDRSVIATSPVGNAVLEFDRTTSTLINRYHEPDVCGVAVSGTRAILSTGYGHLDSVKEGDLHPVHRSALQWDNHLIWV